MAADVHRCYFQAIDGGMAWTCGETIPPAFPPVLARLLDGVDGAMQAEGIPRSVRGRVWYRLLYGVPLSPHWILDPEAGRGAGFTSARLPPDQARQLVTDGYRPYHVPGCPARDPSEELASCDCPESCRNDPYLHSECPPVSRASRAVGVWIAGGVAGTMASFLVHAATGYVAVWSTVLLDVAGMLALAKALDVRRARREARVRPPEGVAIIRADGTTVACSVLREPGFDQDGCTGWMVVPMRDWEWRDGDYLTVAKPVDNTMLGLQLRQPGGLRSPDTESFWREP